MDENLIFRCNKILEELNKFSNALLYLGKPIKDNRIEIFEKEIGYVLPFDFKFIIKKHNKFSLYGNEVMGLGDEFQKSSLDEVYKFEHFVVDNKMPKEFLPFSNDGRGNHYCLDLSRLEKQTCPIVFWQSDFHYSTKKEVETCNSNFLEWIQEVLIDWTLQECNYDGKEHT